MSKQRIQQRASLALALAAMAVCATSCSYSVENDNTGTDTPNAEKYVWTNSNGLKACDHLTFNERGEESLNGTQIGNGDQEFVFTGKQTLKRGTYTLKGWVYIADGAVLTIEPGTVIKGDKDTKATLIAERGGKLIAQGTDKQPIVFTSAQPAGQRKPGDWGGIILCGKAPNNQNEMQIEGGPRSKHGGNVSDDNSGVLSYVRIEFCGYPFEKDKEINGLTLGSVGSGTKIDHVQVSYSNDDAFEWFGGTVNCKNLIAWHTWDDDFDTDNGYSGNVQYGLAVRNPRIADASQSNSFESDNNAGGSTASPITSPTFSNITLVGPKVNTGFMNTADYITAGEYFPNNGSALGRFQAAMHLRRNTQIKVVNSVAYGYPVGVIIDGEKGGAQTNAEKGLLMLRHVYMADMDAVGTDFNKVYEDRLYDYTTKTLSGEIGSSFSHRFFDMTGYGNSYMADITQLGLTVTSYIPAAGSMLLTGASFDMLPSSWFDHVSFIGAFTRSDAADWTKGWADFSPQTTIY